MEAFIDTVTPFAWNAAKVNVVQFFAVFALAMMQRDPRNQHTMNIGVAYSALLAAAWAIIAGLLLSLDWWLT